MLRGMDTRACVRVRTVGIDCGHATHLANEI